MGSLEDFAIIEIFNVKCLLCERSHGNAQKKNGGFEFKILPGIPKPVKKGGQYRCVYCGGPLTTEPLEMLSDISALLAYVKANKPRRGRPPKVRPLTQSTQ